MGTVEASAAAGSSHVAIAFFGERGMDHRADRAGRGPIAAGLFGIATAARDCAPPRGRRPIGEGRTAA